MRVEDLYGAVEDVGLPGILKTVRGGYDGKGQVRIASYDEVSTAYQELNRHGGPFIYERLVEFSQEVSVVVARSISGQVETFPVSENHHEKGILDYSVVPASLSPTLTDLVKRQAKTMATGLGLVGVMALEFFVAGDERILFNEMAPRPHNSGHWSIEGAFPSQFTQHMRAVAGWSIATPILLSPTVMVNLLGDLFVQGSDRLPQVLDVPGVQLHWYGKQEMRVGRKVGHLTALGSTPEEAMARAWQAKETLVGHRGA